MQKAKLLKLADFLSKQVKPRDFNMNYWCDSRKKIPSPTCGTVACALGWATSCFPRSKLKLKDEGYLDITSLVPVYGKAVTYSAGAKMFGITKREAEYLFHPDNYPYYSATKRDVVKRIRDFVKNNGILKGNV